MGIEKEELERICYNCNCFFPASMEEPSKFGICLNDKEFEPYWDELLDNYNYECCKNLVQSKKFSGEREACPDFCEMDMEGCINIDESSDLGKAILSSAKNGQIDDKKLEELILEEQIRNIDFKKLPTDAYSKQLYNTSIEEKKKAVSSLGGVISLGNESAFQALFDFLKQLPPPATIEEVHFKIDILRNLELSKFASSLKQFLFDELYRTPSSNTTRQWISAIFKFLERFPIEEIGEPLEKMLNDKRYSHRIKNKIKNVLYQFY
ncbi:MAG: hypothetical protein K8R79_12230 [Calditrichales bacterium]|nr:hypothetical protein [Calditrichales bacterium]